MLLLQTLLISPLNGRIVNYLRKLSFIEVKKFFVEEKRSLSKFFWSPLQVKSFIKSSSLSEVKKSFIEDKRSLSSMFLESSPFESFIKSSSLSELESQSFVEEKTKSFWVITSLQSKSFSTPSLSFRRKSSKSFNESFVEETKSFCWSSNYPQEICSYPLDSTKQVFLWRSLSLIFFLEKNPSLSLPLMSFLSKKSQSFTTQE